MKNNTKQFYTVKEVSNLLGISRVAVFKKIQKKQIQAKKQGNKYLISQNDLPEILRGKLSVNDEKLLDIAVDKTFEEYGETLKLLGQE